MRFLPVVLCVAFFGCGSTVAGPSSTLTTESQVLQLKEHASTEVAVVQKYDESGDPVVGSTVTFELDGITNGAELSPTQADTDATGTARTTLTVGTSVQFTILATAAGATPVRVTIDVMAP